MQAWVEVRCPGSGVPLAPARADRVELHSSVGGAGFVQAGKCHHTPIPQRQYGGIPAAVRHILKVAEKVCGGIENGYAKLPIEGVILDCAAVDQGASVLQKHHAIAEHVPGQGELRDCSGVRIPQQRPGVIRRTIGRTGGTTRQRWRAVSRSRHHQHFAIAEKRGMHGIDGHEIRQSTPLPHIGLRHGERCP